MPGALARREAHVVAASAPLPLLAGEEVFDLDPMALITIYAFDD